MAKGRLLYDGSQATYIALLTGALKAPPMFVADAFGVSPIRIGKLLEKRGQYNPNASGYSLIDAIRKHYGDFAARVCMDATMPTAKTSTTATAGIAPDQPIAKTPQGAQTKENSNE